MSDGNEKRSYLELLKLANDGTPHYPESVIEGYRKLQVRTSIYRELPEYGQGIRLGIYQAEADYGDDASEKNMERLEEVVAMAKEYEIQLLTFPELYVTGYTLNPRDVIETAEFADGPSVTKSRELAAKNKMAIILPYVEKVESSEKGTIYYDSIAVVGEEGELLDSYKKTHLYGQQERDNFSEGESDFPVHSIFGFPVGVLNCYECEFPELVRILALNGAKLVVGPTAADSYYVMPNGHRSAVPYPDISKTLIPAYAYANHIFYAYANRCGCEERDGHAWHYTGNSLVCGPNGDVIAEAHHEQDTLLITDCVPSHYGPTHPAPDYYYLKDRRPELYKRLCE